MNPDQWADRDVSTSKSTLLKISTQSHYSIFRANKGGSVRVGVEFLPPPLPMHCEIIQKIPYYRYFLQKISIQGKRGEGGLYDFNIKIYWICPCIHEILSCKRKGDYIQMPPRWSNLSKWRARLLSQIKYKNIQSLNFRKTRMKILITRKHSERYGDSWLTQTVSKY